MKKTIKNIFIGVIAITVGLVIAIGMIFALPMPVSNETVYGVSFSVPHAQYIIGDWKEVYDATLEDLGVKNLRLNAYWNEIEPTEGQYDFADLDYQMDKAAEHGAQVILSIGRKLPRWPECHDPEWIKDKTEEEIHKNVLTMLPVVVERYKEHPALKMWQLENEPLLDFGNCPPEDRNFLKQEEDLLRSLDISNPILITDSGELNWWLDAAEYGDIMGTTMYRTVHSARTDKPFSYDYLFPSWLYRAKARLVKLVRDKDVIISELQGEPWGSEAFTEMSKEERLASFSPKRFNQLRVFADRTQLNEAYWWGVEYWYWEKVVNKDNRYWDFAKSVF
jgi:hypothetical protein